MSDAIVTSDTWWPPSTATLKIDANAKGDPCFNLTEFGLGLRSQINVTLFGPADGTYGLTVVLCRTRGAFTDKPYRSTSLTHQIRNVGGHDGTDHVYDISGTDKGRMLLASWFKSGDQICFVGTFPPSRIDRDMIADLSEE